MENFEDFRGEKSKAAPGDPIESHGRFVRCEEPGVNTAFTSGASELGDARKSKLASSGLRLGYKAQAAAVEKRLGSLEEIRRKLGLSQRKVCQLLLVDPSAWTRWTKPGAKAPPHIYRALQWYLALEDKYPALDVGFWLGTQVKTSTTEPVTKIAANVETLAKDITRLKIGQAEIRDFYQRSSGTKLNGAAEFQIRNNGEAESWRDLPTRWLYLLLSLFATAFALGIWLGITWAKQT